MVAPDFVPIDLLQARRPWLSLYGVYIKPVPSRLRAEREDGEAEEAAEPALIQRMLTDELLLTLLQRLGPYTLGRCACVCRQWRLLTDHPRLWERACRDTFTPAYKDFQVTPQQLVGRYRGSWRRVFLALPHLRPEGLYVSRNTYLRQGAVEWRRSNTVHLVVYYRYFRFFADGSLLYRTSPAAVAKVARSMQGATAAAAAREPAVFSGRYIVRGGAVYCCVVYPNSRSTEMRCKLRLRSTHPGANNRLDVERLYTYDRELGMALGEAGDSNPEEEPAGGGTTTGVSRGLATFEFVGWEGVQGSVLNLPLSEMDFYMPG